MKKGMHVEIWLEKNKGLREKTVLAAIETESELECTNTNKPRQ